MSAPASDVQTLTPQRGAPVHAPLRGFAGKGDPGAPGACLWCGDKLRGVGAAIVKASPELAGMKGDYGDNAFCGLRCGYCFGLQLAVFGRRLQVTKP